MPPKNKKKGAVKPSRPVDVDFDAVDDAPSSIDTVPPGCGFYATYTDRNLYPLAKDMKGVLKYRQFVESDLPDIMRILAATLSEPYTPAVYRAFVDHFPDLTLVAVHASDADEARSPPGKDGKVVGCVISNLRPSRRKEGLVGYIAMLAVEEAYRGNSIATFLVIASIRVLLAHDCGAVALETEQTNTAAVGFYDSLSFGLRRFLPAHYTAGVRVGVGAVFVVHARARVVVCGSVVWWWCGVWFSILLADGQGVRCGCVLFELSQCHTMCKLTFTPARCRTDEASTKHSAHPVDPTTQHLPSCATEGGGRIENQGGGTCAAEDAVVSSHRRNRE